MEAPQSVHKNKGPIIIGILLFFFIGIALFNTLYRSHRASAGTMVKDLAQLRDIFEAIDRRCKIISFDYQQNPINFLNIGSFKGSEVGPMNLSYPTLWQGPYLEQNLRIQGIEYQIVYTKKGYFITPGNGVRLPNGKIIGQDIMLNETADITAMMQDEQALLYKEKALAIALPLSTATWKKLLLNNVVQLDDGAL